MLASMNLNIYPQHLNPLTHTHIHGENTEDQLVDFWRKSGMLQHLSSS